MGKLEKKELKRLLSCIRKDSRVIVPPQPGYDSGVHLIGDKYIAVSADPCVGVPEEWFGWLLINYAASDVALSGAKPEFCTINLLAPLATKLAVFHRIMKQTCAAADELNIAVVRGHTGTYAGITTTLGVCTTYGTVAREKLLTSGNAKAGDFIMITKSIGLETLINFSMVHQKTAQTLLGAQKAEQLRKLVKLQSCVTEALALAEIPGVHALHDATEGGLTNALNEVAEASSLGFKTSFEALPFPPEMSILQEEFRLTTDEMLSASSTGTIVAAVEKQAQPSVEETLNKLRVPFTFVGAFTKEKKRVLTCRNSIGRFPSSAVDPYSKILSEKV